MACSTFMLFLMCCAAPLVSIATQRTALSCRVTTTFDDYRQVHGRTYVPDSEEYNMRRGLFDRTVASIDEHNCAKSSLWTRGVNKFADRTEHELKLLQGERPYRSHSVGGHVLALTQQDVGQFLPHEVDWSNLTSMTDIQDQGSCGSCWAVAATTMLRAHAEIWRGDSRKFSVQQLVSCMDNPEHCGGSGGCGGATAELAMKYVMDHGIVHEDDFPYEQQDLDCPANLKGESSSTSTSFLARDAGHGNDGTGGKTVGMSGFTMLPINKMAPVMHALYEYGPVKVSIATPDNFFSYDSGIMDGCPKDSIITHGAVLIGYGQDTDLKSKYWHLQNSWGKDWGEAGHFKFLRRDIEYEESTSCGWDAEPEKGNGCNGGPDKLEVCGMCGILSNVIVPQMIAQGGISEAMTGRRQRA